MLPGSLYAKKTHGRSLFVGEFKNSVVVAPEVEKHSPSNNNQNEETSPQEVSSENTGSEKKENSVNLYQKTLTYADDEGEKLSREEDIKVIWKKTETAANPSKAKKGPAAKAFFTPTSGDTRESEAEQVLELPAVKEDHEAEQGNRQAKKKRLYPVSQPTPGRKIPARQINFPFTIKARSSLKETTKQTPRENAKAPDDQDTDDVAAGDEPASDVAEGDVAVGDVPPRKKDETGEVVEQKSEKDIDEAGLLDQEHQAQSQEQDISETNTIKTPISVKQGSVSRDSGESDHDSQEQDEGDGDTPKSVVIKPPDLPVYAQQTETVEEGPRVLEPDAVAVLKRDLAEKGIIVLPPSQIETRDEQKEAEQKNEDEDDNDEDMDYKESLGGEDGDGEDGDGENNSDKLDRKEGFKTNKSFEIRRLQARAEREREKKRAMFGMRFPQLKVKSEHPNVYHQRYNQGGRSALKSAMKPMTSDRNKKSKGILKDPSPLPRKFKGSVRIRDPEFEYQEYTDVEIESDSADSAQPNSGLSLSDLEEASEDSDSSLFSTTTFNESNTELTDEDSSLQGSDLFRLYDELDELSPSRLDSYSRAESYRENISRESHRSLESRVLESRAAGSSLHLTPQFSHQTPSRAMASYYDKPMPLFDALRHEVNRKESNRKRGNRSRRTFVTKDGEDAQKPRRMSASSYHTSTTPTFLRLGDSNMAAVFGPNLPVPPDYGRGGRHARKGWKKRVNKFLDTSYTHSEVTEAERGDETTASKEQTIPGEEASSSCKQRCRPLYEMLDCSKKSLLSHVLWIALPTAFLSVLFLVLLFIVTGIIPLSSSDLEKAPQDVPTNSTIPSS